MATLELRYNANEHSVQYAPLAVMMIANALRSKIDVRLELDRAFYDYNCIPSESLNSNQFKDLIGLAESILGHEVDIADLTLDYTDAIGYDIPAVITAYGCKNNCTHCPEHKHRGFTNRKFSNVVGEIMQIVNLGYNYFEFVDNNVLNDKENFFKILEYIPKGVEWGALINIDENVTQEDMHLMYNKGCRKIYVGLESLNKADQLYFNKPFAKQGIDPLEFIDMLNSYFDVNTFLIRGLPNETDEDWNNMLKELSDREISYTINALHIDGHIAELHDRDTRSIEVLDEAITNLNLRKFLRKYL